MKLKTRLVIAFFTIIIIPVLMAAMMVSMVCRYQIGVVEKNYGITGTTISDFTNSMQVLARVTEKPYHELKEMSEHASEMEDATELDQFNKKLENKNAYLLVRKDGTIVYTGSDDDRVKAVIEQLPGYGDTDTTLENGIYLGGDAEALIKQVDFRYDDGNKGSAFIVSDVSNVIPEVGQFFWEILIGIVVILILTSAALIIWIYRAVMGPIGKMQTAAQNIKEGNLDFELKPEADDELGKLCQSLEEMRGRLKDSAEEKLKYDKESKELISNISHDLKTPVTTIKGYAEGIIDGVADTPEKIDRYVRTIYNKATEMNTLINELTLYSKIDTNKIPYNFNIVSANEYFNDCADDLSVELAAQNVGFGYFNYVEKNVRIIADPEQVKRVIHNIVNNSLKYMDKPKGMINLRVKDVGDFVQIELEDNGKGIAAKDLPNIFDRFYRTDASRNSSTGGSGIGLSVVKKIVEEHGGKIWATSREETGTTMYFVLRKYQEVPVNE